MSANATIQLLRQTTTFNGLSSDVLQTALQWAHVRQIERGQFLLQQGEAATTFYVLLRGHAKHTQLTQDGHEILIQYVLPGQEVGVIALLSGLVYPFSVQALEPCEALAWPGEALAQLMERHTRLGFNALRVMARLMREHERRYAELLVEHVEQRVARALLRLVEQAGQHEDGCVLINLPLPREDLAEYTGTTLYTVSRILSEWERKGIVATGRERVQVCQPRALARIAGAPTLPQ